MLLTLEFSTPAVCHCTVTALEDLDRVQRRFLREVGSSPEEALLEYNLAPLQTRRDIAMLGLIHRTVLGLSPPQFSSWFFLADLAQPAYNTRRQERFHNKQLHDWLRVRNVELLRRSVLGLVRVYNELPQQAVDSNCVCSFQRCLQHKAKEAVLARRDDWQNTWNLRKKSWRQVRVRLGWDNFGDCCPFCCRSVGGGAACFVFSQSVCEQQALRYSVSLRIKYC